MKFFKHFTDSHEGRSIQALMDQFGGDGYAAYFILMELCAGKLEKKKDQEVTDEMLHFNFTQRYIREKLRMKSTRLELFLNSSSTLMLFKFVKTKDEFNFYVPKLLEYLDRDSKRARTERGPDAPKNKEERKKNKESSAVEVPATAEGLLSLFSQSELDEFKKIYPVDGYAEREAAKAVLWCTNNPKKKPRKNVRDFFTKWLDRGWERERKAIPATNKKAGGWNDGV